MIFFSAQWARGHLDDDLFDGILRLYQEHCSRLKDAYPVLASLIDTSLNDYIVDSVLDEGTSRSIKLSDAKSKILIRYDGVSLLDPIPEIGSEIMYDEVYYDEIRECFVHGILFVDDRECAVHFSSVSLATSL